MRILSQIFSEILKYISLQWDLAVIVCVSFQILNYTHVSFILAIKDHKIYILDFNDQKLENNVNEVESYTNP